MTGLIDVHSHLQFKAFDQDRNEVIKRNLEELDALINVGADLESSLNALNLAETYEEGKSPMFVSFGVHPHHSEENASLDFLKEFEKNLPHKKVVAIGEIGLDKYQYKNYPVPEIKAQQKILEAQISLAQKHSLPIIFHCREAYPELYEFLRPYSELKGLIHCFMGEYNDARRFLSLGLKISFCANLTYKGNEYLQEIAKKLPLEDLLVETDSPYLPPEQFRGQRNEPRYVKIIADQISSLKNTDKEEVFRTLNQTAKKLFSL